MTKLSRQNTQKRVGITARGESPLSEVCEQFGRSYWLLIYGQEECQWYAIDNSLNRTRSYGAGIATAEIMINAGVTEVLTGETGPKAFRILNDAGIYVVHDVSGIVEDVLFDWLNGGFSPAQMANDSGSPNCLLGQYVGRGGVGTSLK